MALNIRIQQESDGNPNEQATEADAVMSAEWLRRNPALFKGTVPFEPGNNLQGFKDVCLEAKARIWQ
jgi:hypothetical protein